MPGWAGVVRVRCSRGAAAGTSMAGGGERRARGWERPGTGAGTSAVSCPGTWMAGGGGCAGAVTSHGRRPRPHGTGSASRCSGIRDGVYTVVEWLETWVETRARLRARSPQAVPLARPAWQRPHWPCLTGAVFLPARPHEVRLLGDEYLNVQPSRVSVPDRCSHCRHLHSGGPLRPAARCLAARRPAGAGGR